jgi:hypothetical protein
MKMQEVKIIAQKWGIPFKVGLSKAELIRTIQKKEGYTDCFQTNDFCEEEACLWRDDCLAPKLK